MMYSQVLHMKKKKNRDATQQTQEVLEKEHNNGNNTAIAGTDASSVTISQHSNVPLPPKPGLRLVERRL